YHLGDLPYCLDRLHRRPRTARSDQMVEGRALDKGHREEMNAAGLVDVVDLTEVGMIDAGGKAGLTLEAFEDSLPVVGIEVGRLARDPTSQLAIFGQVDGPHAAGAEFLEDAVAPENFRQLLVRGHGNRLQCGMRTTRIQPNRGFPAVKQFRPV